MAEKRIKWKDRPTKEKKKIIGIYGTVVLLSLLGIAYGRFMDSQPQDYTIGTIQKIWKPAKGGSVVRYIYSVNKKTYEGDVDYFGFEDVAKPGKRFLVNYPENYVWEGFMNLNLPVPDSLVAPVNGWDKLPNF